MEQIRNKLLNGIKLFDKIAIEQNIEIWKRIDRYDHYLVSSLGRVKNEKTNRILKLGFDKGYHQVSLSKKDVKKTGRIHQLVAYAFIENPLNKPIIDHKNNNKTDNSVKNLRFVTYKENNYNTPISKSNTSTVKGVFWDKGRNKWCSKIKINYESIYIGR